MMRSEERYCKKCWKPLKVYVTCYECNGIYHPKCLSTLSGFLVNEQGFMFCCGDIQKKKPIVHNEALLENETTGGLWNFIHIFDSKVKMGIANRAKKTIPKDILEVKSSELSLDDCGVFALRNIPERAYFGPYEGLKALKSPKGTYIWRIRCGELVDVKTEAHSNWLRYVNSTDNINMQNLTIFQYKRTIYYKTLKEICAGEELLVSFQSNPKNSEINVIEYFFPDTQQLKVKKNKCISCSYGFSNEKLLANHKKICPYNNNEPIKLNVPKEVCFCTTCNMEFPNAKLYVEHKAVCMKNIPLNEKELKTAQITFKQETLQCPICKKSFNRKYNMMKHKEIHDKTRTKDFLCPYCNKSYFYKAHLTHHVNAMHKTNKKYKCNICSYVSISSKELSYHIYKHSNKTEVMDLNDSKDNIQVLNEEFHVENLAENQVELKRPKTNKQFCKYPYRTEVMDLNDSKDNVQVLNEKLYEGK